jgi:hypothetical protein
MQPHNSSDVETTSDLSVKSSTEHVITVADFGGPQEHGVRFSSGDAGRAIHALGEIGELIESGRFSLPVAQTFPLAEVAEAHRVSERGHVRGKLVLLVGLSRQVILPHPVRAAWPVGRLAGAGPARERTGRS